jgi:hypothetical protein
MNSWKVLIDVLGGFLLAFALLFVVLVDRLTTPADRPDPNTLDVRVVADPGQQPAPARKLRLAVLTDSVRNPVNNRDEVWDDMGNLLHQLGPGYQHDRLHTGNLLANPKLLDDYDVLFFTCAPGGQQLRDPLVQFVARGGILYASDWRYDAIADAFPDVADLAGRGEGLNGPVTAEVVDPALRDLLGPTVQLNFDLPRWKFAAFKGPRVTPLVQATFPRLGNAGQLTTVPLLVKFPAGRGQVIFTSFQNETSISIPITEAGALGNVRCDK